MSSKLTVPMGEVRHPRLHAIDEQKRAIDFAKRPDTNARKPMAPTPGSIPKRKARSSSRPASNKASARSK